MNYTIKFDFNTKELITTNKIPILFQENLVDKLLFYVNSKYLETDLSSYVCVLKYITVDHELKYESLTLSTDESVQKEGYLVYTIDIDSGFTEYAGFVKYCLILTKLDSESDIQYIIRSKQNSLYIAPIRNGFNVVVKDDDTIDIQDQIDALEGQVDDLNAISEAIKATMAEDVVVSGDRIVLVNKNGTNSNGVDLEDLGDALVVANTEGLNAMLMD